MWSSSFIAKTRFCWSPDRFVNGHQLGAIRECRFHLHIVDHLGNAVHHLITGNDMRAGFHQIGNGTAITGALDDEIGNQRNRFRIVQLHATFQPAARHHSGHGNQQLVFFSWAKVHRRPTAWHLLRKQGLLETRSDI
ncbi:hypothetical protein AT6N2_C3209 [Agrobacterium tumefaciens]|nr:hypothetical protein AT6N2_C3209 [Agrobacterium tumefaciens]